MAFRSFPSLLALLMTDTCFFFFCRGNSRWSCKRETRRARAWSRKRVTAALFCQGPRGTLSIIKEETLIWRTVFGSSARTIITTRPARSSAGRGTTYSAITPATRTATRCAYRDGRAPTAKLVSRLCSAFFVHLLRSRQYGVTEMSGQNLLQDLHSIV